MAEPEVQGRYDIVNGVRIIMPGATWRHQRIAKHIEKAFDRYEEQSGIGLNKVADYIAIGVDECWVVRPEAGTVEVLILTPGSARSFAVYGDREIFSSPIFRELGVPIADVFAP